MNRQAHLDAAAASPPGGVDPARRLLARARRAKPARRTSARNPAEATWSGAGPDARDPARLGDAVHDLVRDRSWERTLTAAGLLPRWADIVGADIAAHCRPERLTDGELTCVAESTAWATQLRLLNRQLLARIAAEVGDGVVTRLRVHGPTAPDWRHGPLRVMGRGPRDTYG
ncbi:MAG TPA: DciA family protein [Mycobacteriales bacterium]|nr:DciA family protein [Mycobacteriales bacterium]